MSYPEHLQELINADLQESIYDETLDDLQKSDFEETLNREFKFKILAFKEVSIFAKDLNLARRQADVEYHKIFKDVDKFGLFGDVLFIEEIK